MVEQFPRHQRSSVRQHPLIGRQTLPVVQFFHQFDRQRDITDLREHGSCLELPKIGVAQRRGQVGGQSLHSSGAAEGNRIRNGEYVDQGLDAADQCFLQQHLLGNHQSVMCHACFDRTAQLVRRARLGQEAEDLSFVDRRDRGITPGLAGEQNARRVRIQLFDVLQQGRAIHARHAHVRDDHGGRALVLEHLQRTVPAGGGEDLVIAAQVQRQALHDSGLIVHTQNGGWFFAAHDPALVFRGIKSAATLSRRVFELPANRKALAGSQDIPHLRPDPAEPPPKFHGHSRHRAVHATPPTRRPDRNRAA